MSTKNITWQRQLEIIDELQLASRYFHRLSIEINRDEDFRLPGDEGQMAEHIYEGILLLQWRLESFGRMITQIPPQNSMAQHSMHQHSMSQHASNSAANGKSD